MVLMKTHQIPAVKCEILENTAWDAWSDDYYNRGATAVFHFQRNLKQGCILARNLDFKLQPETLLCS